MRMLVTGGAGFLGSHLCERLLKDRHEVLCVDNFSTGQRENIRRLRDYQTFEVIRHDICFPLYVECDAIYNLACPASPVHYQRDPAQTTKTCVHGTINMLGLAKRCGAKVLQASTSEVYGDPAVHPQREDYWGNVNPIGPRACYDEAKRCAETLLYDYHRQHELRVACARIFNTYGPAMAMNDGRVVSNFITAALRGDPITIYGDGQQTRSFCFVADTIEGLVALMESEYAMPVNIGNPHEVTMLTLADEIKALTRSNSLVVHRGLPADDPQRRCPDITRAIDVLGWQPQVGRREGLARTIDFFRTLLQHGK
jgi:UDP-glucuronate decarboxylase